MTRHGKCVACIKDRQVIIGSRLLSSRLSKRRVSSGLQSLGLALTRDPPTGDPLPLPIEQQWKEGLR